MNFHLGKPILVMIVLALLSGLAVTLRPSQQPADLTLWVFADSHFQTFKPLIPEFEKRHKKKVNLNLLSGRAIALRVGQLFMSNKAEDQIPDLVEMEIGLIGRFFRPPTEDVGFLPLNDRLKQSGWYDKIVETRFAPWTKGGVIFGVPHDVHPCVIAYREDLFREAGIDLPKATTWKAFHEACIQFERYWKGQRGFKYRHALELPEASSDYFQVMLLQRGINAIDDKGNIQLDDPRVAETLAFYAQMVAGPRKVTGQTSSGMGAWSKDIVEGNLCSFILPDWRVTYLKRYGAQVAGTMRVMPMPVFDPGDAPTSTWGGTMMGITRESKNPELAWKLLEFLYFSDEGMASRRNITTILSPIKAHWADPIYHEPDPYFGGQKADEVLTEMAGKIPARYVTPATSIASMALNEAVARAGEYVDRRGNADGLEEECRKWLAEISSDLRRRMEQWSFD